MTTHPKRGAGRNIKFTRTLGILVLAWHGSLGSLKALPAQTSEGSPQFDVLMETDWSLHMCYGVLTITGEKLFLNGPKCSFEVALNDVAVVTGHTKLGWVTIKLKHGNTHKFLPDKKRVAALVEVIVDAMSGQQAPAPRPPLEKRLFAPIPAPPPTDPASGPAEIEIGQTPDQVRAILGEPDDIEAVPLTGARGAKMTWSYKSLIVTFIDGKVSVTKYKNLEAPPHW